MTFTRIYMWAIVLLLTFVVLRFIVPSLLNESDDVMVVIGITVIVAWLFSLVALAQVLFTNPKKGN